MWKNIVIIWKILHKNLTFSLLDNKKKTAWATIVNGL